MISQDTLNLISFIAGIFTIIAAVATLIALFFAWRMWKTWKIQQTYALHREKLIENEINIIALYHYQGNVLKQMIEMKQITFERSLSKVEEDDYRNILADLHIKQKEFEDKYGFCVFTIERYDLRYPDELMVDIVGFQKETNSWIKKVMACKNMEDLKAITTEFYFSSAANRDNLLVKLKNFRQISLN